MILRPGKNIHSLMPQRIDSPFPNILNICYRITKPIPDGNLFLTSSDGTEVASRRKKQSYPGEMQSIQWKNIDLKNMTGPLTLNLETLNG